MNIIFRLLYLSMCLLATCEATSLVKHRAVTEDAEYLFGCKVTKKFGVTFILPGNKPSMQVMMGGSHLVSVRGTICYVCIHAYCISCARIKL